MLAANRRGPFFGGAACQLSTQTLLGSWAFGIRYAFPRMLQPVRHTLPLAAHCACSSLSTPPPLADVSRYAGQYEHVFESTTAGVTIQAPQLDINTVAAGGGSRLFFRSGVFQVRTQLHDGSRLRRLGRGTMHRPASSDALPPGGGGGSRVLAGL